MLHCAQERYLETCNVYHQYKDDNHSKPSRLLGKLCPDAKKQQRKLTRTCLDQISTSGLVLSRWMMTDKHGM